MTTKNISITHQKSDSVNYESNSDTKSKISYQWVFDLNKVNSCEYDNLTFPSIQKRWNIYKQRGKLLGVAAFYEKTMVGLVIGECIANTTKAEIISLFVEPNYRHQGIGTNLIQYLEKGLIKVGCKQVQVHYKTSKITPTDFEPLLTNCGWKKPQTKMILGFGNLENIAAKAPWLNHLSQYQLPSDLEIFLWKDLTQSEREEILKTQKEKPWYPEVLSPFYPDFRLETINSLGLRYQGKVVGWMINHRVSEDTIRYSTLFVAKEFQRSGKAMLLLAKSMRLQSESSIPFGKSAVQIENQSMLRIVSRHLTPYLIEQTESRFTKKDLVVV